VTPILPVRRYTNYQKRLDRWPLRDAVNCDGDMKLVEAVLLRYMLYFCRRGFQLQCSQSSDTEAQIKVTNDLRQR
jgi:hypothetical protein